MNEQRQIELNALGSSLAFDLIQAPLTDLMTPLNSGLTGVTSQDEFNYVYGGILTTLCGVIAGVRKAEGGPELLEYVTEQLRSAQLIDSAGISE